MNNTMTEKIVVAAKINKETEKIFYLMLDSIKSYRKCIVLIKNRNTTFKMINKLNSSKFYYAKKIVLTFKILSYYYQKKTKEPILNFSLDISNKNEVIKVTDIIISNLESYIRIYRKKNKKEYCA